MKSSENAKTYGVSADAYLARFYKSCGAETTQQKINVLELKLGQEPSNYYAYGGTLTDEMKLGCLEYDFLDRAGEITLVLA